MAAPVSSRRQVGPDVMGVRPVVHQVAGHLAAEQRPQVLHQRHHIPGIGHVHPRLAPRPATPRPAARTPRPLVQAPAGRRSGSGSPAATPGSPAPAPATPDERTAPHTPPPIPANAPPPPGYPHPTPAATRSCTARRTSGSVMYRRTCCKSNSIARSASPAKNADPLNARNAACTLPGVRASVLASGSIHPRIRLRCAPPPGHQQLLVELRGIRRRQPRITHPQPSPSRAEQVPVKHAPDLLSPRQVRLCTTGTPHAITQRQRPLPAQRILALAAAGRPHAHTAPGPPPTPLAAASNRKALHLPYDRNHSPGSPYDEGAIRH